MELHFLILGHVFLLAFCQLIAVVYPIGVDPKELEPLQTDMLHYKAKWMNKNAAIYLFLPLEVIYWSIYGGMIFSNYLFG